MNIQRLIGLYCLAFLLAGCSNWLDVQPYDQISEDELVKSEEGFQKALNGIYICLLYTSPSPRDVEESRMPSSA